MGQPEMSEGFRLWRHEVEITGHNTNVVPYTALIPLVGIYRLLHDGNDKTSYHWRRTVLANNDAMAGLQHCLGYYYADDLTEEFPMLVSDEAPEEGAALQSQCAYASVQDGLPTDKTTIAWNELFLAKNLGFAVHDDAVKLRQLDLTSQGQYALTQFYPTTAEYVAIKS